MFHHTVNSEALFEGVRVRACIYVPRWQATINRPFRGCYSPRKFSPFDTCLIRSPSGGLQTRSRSSRQYCVGRRGCLTPRELRDVNEITRELVSDITGKLCPLPVNAYHHFVSNFLLDIPRVVPSISVRADRGHRATHAVGLIVD